MNKANLRKPGGLSKAKLSSFLLGDIDAKRPPWAGTSSGQWARLLVKHFSKILHVIDVTRRDYVDQMTTQTGVALSKAELVRQKQNPNHQHFLSGRHLGNVITVLGSA